MTEVKYCISSMTCRGPLRPSGFARSNRVAPRPKPRGPVFERERGRVPTHLSTNVELDAPRSLVNARHERRQHREGARGGRAGRRNIGLFSEAAQRQQNRSAPAQKRWAVAEGPLG